MPVIAVPEQLPAWAEPDAGPVKIAVHNSDRATYRRCRRKWDLASRLRQNMIPLGEQRAPLWYGTGIHFALEDYHGHNRFGDPRRAFDAYVEATNPSTIPPDWNEYVLLAEAMLTYYTELWLPARPGLETLWLDGEPQVEVDVEIPITGMVFQYLIEQYGNTYTQNWWGRVNEKYSVDGRGIEIVIVQVFDRVLVDEYERIWGMDYKTARQFAPRNDLERNSQANQYYWALGQFYGRAAEGLVWQQHLKAAPEPPKELKTGGFSMNKGQSTTYALYRQALLAKYSRIPKGYIDILNHLAAEDTEDGDKYIRRDYIRRNEAHGRAEERKILMEVHEMLDPDIPIYPNPTRDCNWDCPFRDVSTAMDDGSDWEFLLNSEFVAHVGYDDSWRGRIKWPEEL